MPALKLKGRSVNGLRSSYISKRFQYQLEKHYSKNSLKRSEMPGNRNFVEIEEDKYKLRAEPLQILCTKYFQCKDDI
jgi:hypothetical protein